MTIERFMLARGDENREEVATAAGMMKNLLASAGLDFHDLVTLLKDDHMLRLVSPMCATPPEEAR